MIQDWKLDEAKTKQFDILIKTIAPNSKKVLVVGQSFSSEVALASRNLPRTKVSTAVNLAPLDIVQADKIIISEDGMDSVISRFTKE